MHLSGDTETVAVDGDHRICAAIESLPSPARMHGWIARFALLADPTRLTLLLCIHEVGEICVSDLAVAAGLKDSTTSQALRLLRAQNLVSAHRDGRVVRYRLADAVVTDLLERVRRDGTFDPPAPAPVMEPASAPAMGPAPAVNAGS